MRITCLLDAPLLEALEEADGAQLEAATRAYVQALGAHIDDGIEREWWGESEWEEFPDHVG